MPAIQAADWISAQRVSPVVNAGFTWKRPRKASARTETGLCWAKPRNQLGIVATGTKALDANVSGKSQMKPPDWAASTLRTSKPIKAEIQEKAKLTPNRTTNMIISGTRTVSRTLRLASTNASRTAQKTGQRPEIGG